MLRPVNGQNLDLSRLIFPGKNMKRVSRGSKVSLQKGGSSDSGLKSRLSSNWEIVMLRALCPDVNSAV